eukprot:296987-Chlamydomonas_euryale.AAC.2
MQRGGGRSRAVAALRKAWVVQWRGGRFQRKQAGAGRARRALVVELVVWWVAIVEGNGRLAGCTAPCCKRGGHVGREEADVVSAAETSGKAHGMCACRRGWPPYRRLLLRTLPDPFDCVKLGSIFAPLRAAFVRRACPCETLLLRHGFRVAADGDPNVAANAGWGQGACMQPRIKEPACSLRLGNMHAV